MEWRILAGLFGARRTNLTPRIRLKPNAKVGATATRQDSRPAGPDEAARADNQGCAPRLQAQDGPGQAAGRLSYERRRLPNQEPAAAFGLNNDLAGHAKKPYLFFTFS